MCKFIPYTAPLLFLLMCTGIPEPHTVILISADGEWKAVREILAPGPRALHASPYGEWFRYEYQKKNGTTVPVIFFHGGWGKIDAAASTQYAITRWRPGLLINLGTAGGFRGSVGKGELVLAVRTVTYDIYERMGNAEEAVRHYSTDLDAPASGKTFFRKGILVSADRDLDPAEIPFLKKKYGAVAGDWESGAIAHVAKRNRVKLYIVRGITDVVDGAGSETYGNYGAFEREAKAIMKKLLEGLAHLL